MKTKSLLIVALLAMASSVSAQFANTNTSSGGNNMRNIDTNGWQKVYVSYNPLKMIMDVESADDVNMTGFSLGYSKGYSISKDFPLFAEAGIEATYAFNTVDKEDRKDLETDSNGDLEMKTTYFSVTVPVNLAYKFTLAEKNISIVPYFGVNLKGNIIGKSKKDFVNFKESYNYDTEKEYWEAAEEDGDRQETNWFDKKEAGSKDAQWKRIQFGWQLGVGLYYNQIYVGVGYSKDFSELCKKTKVSKTSITLGYTF